MHAASDHAMSAARGAAHASGRVVIAGLGLFTPLGGGAWPTFSALLAGRTLGDRAAELPADIAPVDLVRATGAVRVAQHTSSDPAVELAELAAREALFAAGGGEFRVPGSEFRVAEEGSAWPTFVGTSKGAVRTLVESAAALPGVTEDQALAVALGPCGYMSHRLRERLPVAVMRHCIAACASSLTALHHARQFLLQAEDGPSTALVLTAEAALLPMFIYSYQKLGVLAPLVPGEYRQRPLDAQRCGFMLAEAGAAVVLRRLPPGEAAPPGQIELVDTAIAAEGYDLIRPAPTMPALGHVARQLLRGRSIDMIHPHATGTPEHDPVELAAYRDALAGSSGATPDLYACKGALGHGLGAAGLSALILACLCLQSGRRPPMPWLRQPIDAAGFTLEAAARPCSRTGTHAVFAEGFGGHVAGAVVSRF